MGIGDGIVNRAVQVLDAMTGGAPLRPLQTELTRRKKEDQMKLLREIARRAERSDFGERDVQELREMVRDLDLSEDKSLSATGTSRLEMTTTATMASSDFV